MKDTERADEQVLAAEIKVLIEEQVLDQQLRSNLKAFLDKVGYEHFSDRFAVTRTQRQFWKEFYRTRRLLVHEEKTRSNYSSLGVWLTQRIDRLKPTEKHVPLRPPFNAEYLLYLLLRKKERDEVIGDLIESYGDVLRRFSKRHADIWFYKQVAGSVLPLLRRALLRIGALVWLGRILRRLIS